MPYAVPLSSILELRAEMTVNGQKCMSIFHYKYTTGSAITDGQAALVDFLNKIRVAGKLKDKYIACIPDQVLDILWWAQWIAPQRFRHTTLAVASDQGTVANNPLPVNVSAAITKVAQVANRHGVGTLHMPAVPVNFVADSLISVAGFLAYDDLGVEIKAPVVLTTGQQLDPCLYNRANSASSELILTTFTQGTSRVNRRRTVGVGA